MDAFGVHTAHRFRARSDAIADARRAAIAYAREHAVPADRLDAIALAVSEATTNVVLHAYRDRPDPGTFRLELDLEGDSLLIDVRDDGLGMGPRDDSPGLGFGLPIIANVTDAYALVPTDDGGTWLSMRFDLSG
jgi:serine/threonine-protein kinase RsbW/stage II sporulation protein AB (anti-sigma F factor)